jgi:exosortase A
LSTTGTGAYTMSIPPGWRSAAALAVLASLFTVGLFWPTAWSMVQIWSRSDTFAHGFLIVPITLWLIWHRRHHLAAVVPAFSWLGLAAFVVSALAWLAGDVADALVVAQFGLVGMLVGGVWAILGNQAARELVFALGFLFLAVPVGEALVPPLMEFTASFTVGLLRLTGIPVYRDGLFFSLPSGNWSVVDACSGIRYVIASVTLGVLYAYLAYQSRSRRVVFILVSAVVPVLANGLRAYSIVMIAHLTDMKLATGIDHLIWGWLFFGIVMLIIFSIGATWREPEAVAPAPASAAVIAVHGRGVALGAALIVVAMLVLRAGANHIAAHQSVVLAPTRLPAVIGEWVQVDERPWTWAPHFLPAELGAALTYRRGNLFLTVDVAHFVQQRQDAEVVNSQNQIVYGRYGRETEWRVANEGRARLDTYDGHMAVDTFRVRGPQSLAVWRWYRIGSRDTTNPYLAKLYQALDRLTLDRTDGAIVVVAAPLDSRDQSPDAEVAAFIRDLVPALSRALDASVGE